MVYHILAWHLHEHLAPDLWVYTKALLEFLILRLHFALMCTILMYNICYDT